MLARLFAIATLVACAGEPPNPSTPATNGAGPSPLGDTDDAVLEAVFLHEIAAAKPDVDEGICLGVRGADGKTGDASANLIEAVRRRFPSTIPASKCKGGGHDHVRVVEPARAGIKFDIGPVKRAEGIRVEGGGGHRGGGAIREVEYVIEKAGVSYRVASEKVLRQN